MVIKSQVYRMILVLKISLLSVNPVVANNSQGLSRGEVLKAPLKSMAVNAAIVTSVGFIDSADVVDLNIPFWFSALVASEHIPLYSQDPLLARKYSIGHGSLMAAHYATREYPTWSLIPFNAHIKLAMFSSYKSYSIARVHAGEGVYKSHFEPMDLRSLSAAPFQVDHILDPVIYIPLGLSAIFQVANMLGSEDAIWKTGETYIDGKEVSPGLAIPLITAANMTNNLITAIGEEALYRGVIYEELKVSFGPKRAKIYDFFLFPAIHLPQDLARGLKPGAVTGLFIMRGLNTLLFDYAYDRGGLPLSVSLHTWLNMLGYTTRWLGSAGVATEQESAESNSFGPSMSVGFTIRF